MYCPECHCEFSGWTGKCPACRTPLVQREPFTMKTSGKMVSYEDLVSMVRERGGRLHIDLVTTDVGQAKKYSFPYQGHGFAWAKQMQGAIDDLMVDLQTTEVGMAKKHQFPYQGYGYAWERQIQGHIGGNALALKATEVISDKKWDFPYFGFGFAWAKELTGECGSHLTAALVTTEVARDKKYRFPYLGYGFAWVDKAVLTLTLTGPDR